MTAASNPFRIGGGGDVKWAGDRGAPVDEQGLVVVFLVKEPNSADVGGVPVDVVEPTEAEPVVGDPEKADPLGERGRGHIPLPEGLGGLRGTVEQDAIELAGRSGTLGVQTSVQKR